MTDLERIATAPSGTYDGPAYRHQSPRYDPRSGEGARMQGGRFNPPESFPVLYLCETEACARAELVNLARRHVVGVAGLLPRRLYVYELQLGPVLDLSDERTGDHVGAGTSLLTSPDWTACQELGAAVHAAGYRGIISPSATGVDRVIAVFTDVMGSGLVSVREKEEWSTLEDLEG